MTFRRPPLPGKDLGAWARQMYEYMSSQSPIQGSVDPTPLLLAHLTDGQVARAATDGVLLFDPVAGKVVVSIGGAFVTLGPYTLALPDIITAGSAGDADSIPQITVDAKGRVTALSQIDVSIAAAKINDSTAAGRAMLLAADAAAQTALLDPFTSLLKGLVPASGSDTQLYLRADGTWASSGPRLQPAIAAAAQTSIDFTGIPSWVNRVTLTASGLSTNGTSAVIVQIGDSGGVETTGYIGGVFTTFNTGTAAIANLGSGFNFSFVVGDAVGDTAASVRHFSITISRHSGNTWFGSGSGTLSNTQYFCSVTGTKALSSVLDRVRVTTAGGVDTFDAGGVSISWE